MTERLTSHALHLMLLQHDLLIYPFTSIQYNNQQPVAQWLSYLTWICNVGGSIPGVASTAVGPLSKALNPTFQGVCLLLSLINCKSLWIKASAKCNVMERSHFFTCHPCSGRNVMRRSI